MSRTTFQAICGTEPLAQDGGPLDALIAFYKAFNTGDIEGLAKNWAAGETPSMNNPIGGIRRGWPSIREGYEKLFMGPARVRVEFFDFRSQGGDDYHLFAGRERGICTTPAGSIDLRIRTTRWFVRQFGHWQQIHHHGSIEEPELLASYQRAILGKIMGKPA
jgi:hypothetical protein